MTDSQAENAQDWLDALSLPEDAQEVLRRPKYWNVTFCRLYLERCEDLRFENPQAGLRAAEVVAELAYRVPKHQCGGEAGWCSLQVRALGVVGSAHRAVCDFSTAEAVFLLATILFADDADDLACADLLQRTAYLRAAQHRFEEAEHLVDEAIDIYAQYDESHLLGCALGDRGVIFGRSRKLVFAVRDLSEALTLIDEERAPRHHYAAVHNLADALSQAETLDPEEALHWLQKAQELNQEPETSESWTKLLWTEGRIRGRLGHLRDAQEALETVRGRFRETGGALDYALVSIELAEVFFLEGRTAKVRELAGEMFPLFKALKVDPDALNALRLFHRAAFAETLTAELFRVVKKTLSCREVRVRGIGTL